MGRRCDLTNTGPISGHNVSHSNRKTKRRFEANLQQTSLYSEALGRSVALRVSTRALRSVSRAGGIDAYLLRTDDAKLAPTGLRIKRQVRGALVRPKRPAQARS